MIKLTAKNRDPFWLNPDHIVRVVGRADGLSVIECSTDRYGKQPLGVFTESPEEVVRKIINYKLAMIEFTSNKNGVTQVLVENGNDVYEELRDEYGRICELAGLEVTK